jgi:hypothetical protein
MTENSFVKNCTLTTEEGASWIGGIAGAMYSEATSSNNTVDDLSLTLTGDGTSSGCLFGVMIDDNLH